MFDSTELEKFGEPIWRDRYLVATKQIDSYSEEELRTFGRLTTGDKQLDTQINNDLVDRYLTINEMVELHKQGINFIIRNHSETKVIYEIIHAYLNCWRTYLENGINVGGAPIEDLVELDKLAGKIFPHATEHFPREFIQSHLVRILNQSGLNRQSFVKNKIQEEDNKPKQEHKSLATFFSEKVFGGRKLG